jgi:DNA primase
MFSYRGSSVELYGWDNIIRRNSPIIVCEGEFDRLVLEARGFAAVTSTGGAATFRPEWAKELAHIEQVYVCFDRDNAGKNGAQVVALMIPHVRIVRLPDEVGEGGDVSDYFVRLGHSREEFLALLETAKPAPEHPQIKRSPSPSQMQSTNSFLAQRIRRIKTEIPIERVISEYVQLQPSGKTIVGRCPFHDDRTPSFAVYPQNGNYHCFGCRAHGDVINFIQRIEGMSFGQALDALDQPTLDNGHQSQQNQPESKAA